jgi:hypothetical protein
MDPRSLHEDDWDYVRTLLPTDLEDSARLTQALCRCRNVPDAAALIRMALAFAQRRGRLGQQPESGGDHGIRTLLSITPSGRLGG